MDYQILQIEINESIALVTINRPEAMNALNTRFFQEMDQAIAEISKKPGVKVMVITGSGKAFVAGADIAEMVNKNPDEGSAFSRIGQNTFRSLEKMEIPVIAAINGFALGGGLELAMGCDVRIASTRAKFGQPEVNLGLIPGYAGTQRLSRLVGPGDALYLLMSAEMIGAEDALRIGLVQKVVEPELLMEEVMKLAKTIAGKGPLAIKKVKAVTRKGLLMEFEKGCQLEAMEFGSLFGKGSEGEEGMKAFWKKENPIGKKIRQLNNSIKYILNNMNYDERLQNVSVLGAAGKMGSGILLLTAVEMADLSLKPENKGKTYCLNAIDVSHTGLAGLMKYLNVQVRKVAEKKTVLLRNLYADRADLIENEDIISEYIFDVLNIVRPVTNIEAAYESNLVFEAIIENLDLKTKIFSQIRENNKNVWFFTNTSSIPIHILDEKAGLNGNILGFHFYNPPAVQRLVELITIKSNSQEIIDFANAYAKGLRKVVVPSNDFAGFIGNGHFMRDALHGIQEVQSLSKEMPFIEALYTVNKVSQDFLVRPMGIFQLIDYVGIDVVRFIMNVMNPHLPNENLHSDLLDKLFDMGVKGGQNSDGSQKDGFLKYDRGRPVGVFNPETKKYDDIASFQAKCDERLGALPGSWKPWKAVNFSRGAKEGILAAYFNELAGMQTKGAQLAKAYHARSIEIGNQLVSSGVAHNADDVNTVMLTGFYHAFGPINDYM